MEEVAAKILELRAAIVRAGCSGKILLAMPWQDSSTLEMSEEYMHPLRRELEDSKSLAGCPVVVLDDILEALQLLRNRNEARRKENMSVQDTGDSDR
jgi:hypothetical protein